MRKHAWELVARPLNPTTWVALIVLTGCSAGQVGSELAVRPKGHSLGKPDTSTTLRLPQQNPFNITLTRANKQPGLLGAAEVDATAESNGTATARAAVREGGQAEALFQIGHALENSGERQTDADFKISFQRAFDVSGQAEPGVTDAVVSLWLYVRNARGRLVRDVQLLSYTSENGPARNRGTETQEFTLTLAPGETMNVFLAGNVQVKVPDGRSASGSLTVSNLQFEIVTRPAPAVRTASDERP